MVGVAGAMHVYQALLEHYGDKIIGPSVWISGNSRYRFSGNAVSDGIGCDFKFQLNGKTHFKEINSRLGEDESFESGSSETRLAIETVGKRKRICRIVHVRDALPGPPTPSVLPNPYDKRSRQKFWFEDASMRVRYRSSTDVS